MMNIYSWIPARNVLSSCFRQTGHREKKVGLELRIGNFVGTTLSFNGKALSVYNR